MLKKSDEADLVGETNMQTIFESGWEQTPAKNQDVQKFLTMEMIGMAN